MAFGNVAHKMVAVLQRQGQGCSKLHMNQEGLTNQTEFVDLPVKAGLIWN